jgi:serine/threonine protein kinase
MILYIVETKKTMQLLHTAKHTKVYRTCDGGVLKVISPNGITAAPPEIPKDARHIIQYTSIQWINESLLLKMDYYPKDFFKVIVDSDYTLDQAMGWFKQICIGLKSLHDCKEAHWDLKPENILVSEKGDLYLADYGISLGTMMYNPVEKNLKWEYDPLKADIWSLGICLFLILKKRFPFNPVKHDPAFKKFKKDPRLYINHFLHGYGQHIVELVTSMLAIKENARPSIDSIIKKIEK